MTRPGSLHIVILTLICLLALAHGLYHWTGTIDDSYISFRYALNLADGEGLVFNPGERVEGYSNLVWTLVLTLFILIGMDPMLGAKLLGLVSALLTLLVLDRLLARTVANWIARLAGLFFFALAVPSAYWSMQGMETSLFTLFLCLTFWRFGEELEGGRSGPWSAVLLFLACLTRPEGPLYLLVIIGYRLAHGRRPWRRDLGWLVMFLLPMAAHLTWRHFYYGELLPNTYFAKGMAGAGFLSLEARGDGLAYIGQFLSMAWGLPAIFGGLGVLTAIWAFFPWSGGTSSMEDRRRCRSRFLTAALWFTAALFFAWHANGDWMPNSRFLVPGIPALALLAAAGIEGCGRLAGRLHRPSPETAMQLVSTGLALLLVMVMLIGVGGESSWRLPDLTGGQRPRLLPMAMSLMETLRDGETVVYGDIGIVGYLNPRLRIIDNRGLTHKTMARLLFNRPHRMDQAGRYREEFLEEFATIRPESAVVVINRKANAPVWQTETFALHPGFRRNYVEKERLTHRRKNTEVICLRRDLIRRKLAPDEVIAHYQRAIRLAPRASALHFRLAKICREAGRDRLRRETLEDAARRFAGSERIKKRLERVQ